MTFHITEARSNFLIDAGLNFLRVGEGCPNGTVPIKRLTKKDLIKERDLQIRSKTTRNNENAHFALSRTRHGQYTYNGAGAIFTVWNPKATVDQYSSSRLLIQRGPDSIEVGWRVDPFLTGDTRTHFYVHTNALNTHCFGIKCRGFVVTSRDMAIDAAFNSISTRGGTIFDFQIDILRDEHGNWRLRVGPNDKIELGYWPSSIFTEETGLTQMANYIEWGGEVFSRPNVAKPPMGSGNFPVEDSHQSSSIKSLTYRNELRTKLDAKYLVPFEDSADFQVIDVPQKSVLAKHLVFFGGPGGKV